MLFLSRTVSIIGNAFATTAIAFAVLDVTGSKADLGYVLAARAAPQVVFLLVGGVWADRLPRHLVMVGSNLRQRREPGGARRPAADRLGGLRRADRPSPRSTARASAFFFPASSGIIPQTVPADLLQPANALLRLGLQCAAPSRARRSAASWWRPRAPAGRLPSTP